MPQKLSILIPAYNEAKTIDKILDKVLEVTLIGGIEKELVIVNDCSTDNTAVVIQEYIQKREHVLIKLF
ncbi:MAG: glycosyl transferase, partial [Bacteroidetes bacterium CG_4_9_14_3_um_filter_41_19]